MTTQTRTDTHETRTNSPSAHVVVHDKSGLYVSIAAIILACVNLGVLIMMPTIIDAKVQAGVARAEMTANAGREHARIALDKVEQAQVQLGAKGLIRIEQH